MVVGVEVAPALPLSVGEGAEDGVGLAGHVRVGEATEDFHQAGFVMVEVARPGAVLFLVDLGARWHALHRMYSFASGTIGPLSGGPSIQRWREI